MSGGQRQRVAMARALADWVGVMKDGRLEEMARPSELTAEPATAFVAEFVGTGTPIPGRLRAGTGSARSAGRRHR